MAPLDPFVSLFKVWFFLHPTVFPFHACRPPRRADSPSKEELYVGGDHREVKRDIHFERSLEYRPHEAALVLEHCDLGLDPAVLSLAVSNLAVRPPTPNG